jgi:hypothetical protein
MNCMGEEDISSSHGKLDGVEVVLACEASGEICFWINSGVHLRTLWAQEPKEPFSMLMWQF